MQWPIEHFYDMLMMKKDWMICFRFGPGQVYGDGQSIIDFFVIGLSRPYNPYYWYNLITDYFV